MTEFEKADTNGDGIIDRHEWYALELEDKRRQMEDADAHRDQQRQMVWVALWGMLLYPLSVVLSSYMGLEQATDILGSMATIYFPSVSLIVGAFFGFSNMKKEVKEK